MDILISSNFEADYLLINVTGSVNNMEDMKSLTRQIYDEIMNHNSNNVLINQQKFSPLELLVYQADLVDFYSNEFPVEIRRLKLAVVTDSKYKRIANFWETYSNNRGFHFKVFYSLKEAQTYLRK